MLKTDPKYFAFRGMFIKFYRLMCIQILLQNICVRRKNKNKVKILRPNSENKRRILFKVFYRL